MTIHTDITGKHRLRRGSAGAAALLALARRSDNARWMHLGDWSRTIGGAWWLRRSVYAPEDLPARMGREQAQAVLRDSDGASMDHSVELRTLLVDAHLLSQLQPLLRSFARCPGKALLAGAPQRALPGEVIVRGKMGFGILMASWMGARRRDSVGDGSREWARAVAEAYAGSLA